MRNKTYTLPLIILVSFFFASSVFSQGWEFRNSTTANTLRDISFSDPTNGYIVGTFVGLTTFNSGNNWSHMALPFTDQFASVYFTDFITGFAGGVFGNSYIYKTTNGGVNFYVVHTGSDNQYNSIHFPNASTGYAVASNGSIIKTVNAGETWTYQSSGTSNSLNSVYFVTPSIGFAASAGGIILFTVNGGATWTSAFTGVPFDLYSIRFTNAFTGYACGQVGTIIKTTNAGLNWTLQPSGVTSDLRDMDFPSDNTGYAVGFGGVILKTTNSGSNWHMQISPTLYDLYAVDFVDNDMGMTCGTNGILLKTTDGGGSVGITPIGSEVPESFSLSQNYPNPFNPTTTIRFGIPEATNIKLNIYDMSGRLIQQLVNEKLNAGYYEYSFDASQYSSGTYFYRLEGKDFVMTKKMMLVK